MNRYDMSRVTADVWEYIHEEEPAYFAAVKKSGLSEADYRRERILQEYGETSDISLSGWIFPDGRMPLMGDPEYGRTEDHRLVVPYFEPERRYGVYSYQYEGPGCAIRDFMSEGNIRWCPEAGIDISLENEITSQQKKQIIRALKYLSREDQEWFYVEMNIGSCEVWRKNYGVEEDVEEVYVEVLKTHQKIREKKMTETNEKGDCEEIMNAFLVGETNSYAILRAKNNKLWDITEDEMYESFSDAAYKIKYRFKPFNELIHNLRERKGIQSTVDDYKAVYTAPLPRFEVLDTMLEEIYERFNTDRPADFKGYGIVAGDIIAIRQNGMISCYYIKHNGFKEIPGFLDPWSQSSNVPELVVCKNCGIKPVMEKWSSNGPMYAARCNDPDRLDNCCEGFYKSMSRYPIVTAKRWNAWNIGG